MGNPNESTPEKYLREIRDLQKQNLEILQKLSQQEENKASQKKLATLFGLIGTLLPYLLAIGLVWGFYLKISDLTSSVINTVKDIPSEMSIHISDQWDSVTDNFSDKKDAATHSIKDKWSKWTH